MSRDVSINAVIRLPRLTRISLVAFVWQMLTAASAVAGEGLPLAIERARKRLEDALEIFKSSMQQKNIIEPQDRLHLSRFGELIGFTAPLQVDVPAHFMDLSSALPTYICKVIAHADPDEPGSEDLTNALLVPLVQWKDTSHRAGHEEASGISDDLSVDTVKQPDLAIEAESGIRLAAE